MTDTERIVAIAQTKSLAKARQLTQGSPPGFEQALFASLRHESGRDNGRAVWLAKVGESFTAEREHWAHRFRGVRLRGEMKWIASANAFLRAERASGDPATGASMAVGAIDSFARAGRVGRAVEEGRRLFQILERGGDAPDAGRAALNVGNALLWADRVEEAIEWLDRAVTLLDAEPLERGAALLGLSTAHIDYGTGKDVAASAILARRIFESEGLVRYSQICDQNLAQAALMEGRLDDALETLRSLRANLQKDGEDFARNEQFLGETYLRLNMPVEARQAFSDALAANGMRGLGFNKAQIWLGIAEAEAALGRQGLAILAAERARSGFKKLGNMAGATLARCVAMGANKDLTVAEDWRALLAELRRHGLRRKTTEVLALIAEQASDPSLVEVAREHCLKFGLGDLVWRVEAADARTSTGERRLEAYRRMAGEIFSARALQRSTVSRQHFLQDKDEALREYLGLLLSDGPERDVEAALSVVRSARSAALLDEIIGARGARIDPTRLLEFERIREELRSAIGDEERGGPSRRGVQVDLGRWQRAWREAESLVMAQHGQAVAEDPDITFISTGGHVYRVVGGRAVRSVEAACVAEQLKWLEFDLLEPLVNPEAKPSRALSQSWEVAGALVGILDSDSPTICPDLGLWGAPWPLLVDAVRPCAEPVICVAPSCNGLFRGLRKGDKLTIWYQETDRLPHIKREVQRLCELFPGARVCCSVVEVRECLRSEEGGLLHIAAHARLNRWNPMFSSLQFHDGQVFAAEIARGALRPRLVTMSACESGSLSTVNRNEPDGLVRAALALGAESVVGSAWSLDDRAARDFVVRYYQSLRDGADVIEAVRAGRAEVRKSMPHPFYWGAMVTFGGHNN